jgi:hypothetical protein
MSASRTTTLRSPVLTTSVSPLRISVTVPTISSGAAATAQAAATQPKAAAAIRAAHCERGTHLQSLPFRRARDESRDVRDSRLALRQQAKHVEDVRQPVPELQLDVDTAGLRRRGGAQRLVAEHFRASGLDEQRRQPPKVAE